MRIAYFVGAGCSFGTLKEDEGRYPPIASQFGPQLAARIGEDLERDYPTLVQVASHFGSPLQKIGLEDLWTCIDYHAKFPATFRIRWEPRGRVVRELKKALLRLYGSACTEVAEQLSLDAKYTLREIIEELKPGDTLISFNYDTVVESLCHRAGKELFHRCAPDDKVIRFAKPHGSTSWDLMPYDPSNRIVALDGEPKRSPLDALNKNAPKKRRVDPLLLGAVPLKSELISEVQEHYATPRVYDVILSQWRAVADSIRDADKLVVLGYSFPAEDTYGKFFYREAMLERAQRHCSELQVQYYETCDNKDKTRHQIECALNPTKKPHVLQPPCFMEKVTPAPKVETLPR